MIPKKPEAKRPGSWEQIHELTDPDSNVSILISERIRGKPGYAFQIVHQDHIGPNKYVLVNPPGAKHNIEDIVFSLVKAAREYIQERKKG